MAELKKKWLTAKDAAEILTAKSEGGHEVSDAYVRRLGNTGKIGYEQVDGRTRLYSRSDVERYVVTKRGDGSIREAARRPRPRQPKNGTVTQAMSATDVLLALIHI